MPLQVIKPRKRRYKEDHHSDSDNEDKFRRRPQTATEINAAHLEKLFNRGIEKPVYIPALNPKPVEPKSTASTNHHGISFIHDCCEGTVASAGSGDFHLYRSLRRKEMERQNLLDLEQTQV